MVKVEIRKANKEEILNEINESLVAFSVNKRKITNPKNIKVDNSELYKFRIELDKIEVNGSTIDWIKEVEGYIIKNDDNIYLVNKDFVFSDILGVTVHLLPNLLEKLNEIK